MVKESISSLQGTNPEYDLPQTPENKIMMVSFARDNRPKPKLTNGGLSTTKSHLMRDLCSGLFTKSQAAV